MPVATGIFRPAVIMPTDADTWSESRLRIVLLHELAHVKRRDCLTHMLGQAPAHSTGSTRSPGSP